MFSPVQIWRNQKRIVRLIGKTGRLLSWTVIRVPPGELMSQAPYPVVIVALRDGHKICAQLVDWNESHLRLGQKVVTVVRRVTEPSREGVIPYGIKTRPL